jgi:hypothetical protein
MTAKRGKKGASERENASVVRLFVLWFVVSCSPTVSLPKSSPATRVTASHDGTVDSSTQQVNGGCRCASRHNLRTIERARSRAISKLATLLPNSNVLVPHAQELLPEMPCWDTPAGAWAVVVKEAAVCPRQRNSLDGWFAATSNRLAHVDARTCKVVQSPVEWPHYQPFDADPRFDAPEWRCQPTYAELNSVEPSFYDFNNDGEPEIWLARSFKYWDGSRPDTYLLSFGNQQITSYARPNLVYDELLDHDGDGRPDLIWRFDLGVSDDCSDHGHTASAPPFLAHSLPDGRFAFDDAVARAYVQTWCSEAPRVIDSVEAVTCARLFGRSSAVLLRGLEAVPPTDCDAPDTAHELSALAPAMREAASLPLPFTLAPPPTND